MDHREEALLAAMVAPKGVLFDLDMTLVETREDIAMSTNAVRLEFGLDPLPVETLVGYVGDGVKKLLARALGPDYAGREDESLQCFREHYADHCLDRSLPYDGISELLASLAPRELGVVSNKPERFCIQVLKGLGLHDLFRVVFGGDSVDTLKPDPKPLISACEEVGLRPEECVMVGDTWRDVRAGRAAGCRTIGVTYGLGTDEELSAENADAIAETPADIGLWIERWS